MQPESINSYPIATAKQNFRLACEKSLFFVYYEGEDIPNIHPNYYRETTARFTIRASKLVKSSFPNFTLAISITGLIMNTGSVVFYHYENGKYGIRTLRGFNANDKNTWKVLADILPNIP